SPPARRALRMLPSARVWFRVVVVDVVIAALLQGSGRGDAPHEHHGDALSVGPYQEIGWIIPAISAYKTRPFQRVCYRGHGSAWRCKTVHQDECGILPLMDIDERDKPSEMLGRAMGVQRRSIRPFLDEDEVAGVFLVHEKIIGDAE